MRCQKRGKRAAVIEGKGSGRKELFLFKKRGQAPFLEDVLLLKKRGLSPLSFYKRRMTVPILP
jgi:hypothetical protein